MLLIEALVLHRQEQRRRVVEPTEVCRLPEPHGPARIIAFRPAQPQVPRRQDQTQRARREHITVADSIRLFGGLHYFACQVRDNLFRLCRLVFRISRRARVLRDETLDPRHPPAPIVTRDGGKPVGGLKSDLLSSAF